MGLASALSTALTGLSAAETSIDVVGNNLANSNTVGFKASEAAFATQFLQTRSLGSGPSQTSGGSNPRQIGLGTMVADITPNFSQGTVEISSNPTDMAIQGDGFFIVEGRSGAQAYTRNGIFKMNSDSELTTVTGNRVLGFGVNDRFEIQTTALQPISIPLGSLRVAKTTEHAYLEGILTPTGARADAATVIQTGVLGDASYTAPTTAEIPGTEISGRPNITTVGFTPDYVTPGGSVGVGQYSYKLVFSDGAPGGAQQLEGTPSAASVVVDVTNPNATVDITGFSTLPHGAYDHINVYRATITAAGTGAYKYLNTGDATDLVFHDTYAAGTTTLNEDVLNAQYQYYVAYGKAGSPASRPTNFTNTITPANGRIHFPDLQIPASNPNGWDSWIIYRNAPSITGCENRYFELEQISFASPTNYFTDNVQDSALYTSETVHAPEIDLDGPKIQNSTLLSNVRSRSGNTYSQVFTGTGNLKFTGQKGGADVSPDIAQSMTVTAATTVGDFMAFVNDSLGIQPYDTTTGVPRSLDLIHETIPPTYISPGGEVLNGRIRFTGNNGVDNDIDITKLEFTSTSSLVNLPFTAYQNGRGESTTTTFNAYDSLGIPCNVRMTAVLESQGLDKTTTFRWFADSKNNQLASGAPALSVGTGTVTFDSNGNYLSSSNPYISINRDRVASNSPLQFDLNFSAISGLKADSSTLTAKQDGSGPGVLSSFIVGEDGLITGVFDNGENRNLGQIRLVRFSNPAGLEQLGENMYTAGVNSGVPVEGNPGEQGIGSLVAGAVELSNADVGSNLIDLILASTMYRGNTKVITTVQTMLETLLQLQR
jgi:flagellar hook protein FlgE